jgi:hypothetical protein
LKKRPTLIVHRKHIENTTSNILAILKVILKETKKFKTLDLKMCCTDETVFNTLKDDFVCTFEELKDFEKRVAASLLEG